MTLQTEIQNKFDVDFKYRDLVMDILYSGERKQSRGGKISDTLDLFGPQIVFDLRNGFPILSTKKIKFSNIVHELMWFLRGESNINTLKAPNMWKPWANEETGDCGPIYGVQWKHWERSWSDAPNYKHRFIDQMRNLIDDLKNKPDSRRHIVTAWNPGDIEHMALPPCHCFFQCSVSGQFLDLKMYQRSADTAIGVPYNIASYALLQTMFANEVGLTPRRFIHTFGSAHIYEPHIAKIKEQVGREPREMPQLIIRQRDNGKNLTFWDLVERDSAEDFELVGYNPHGSISYELEV